MAGGDAYRPATQARGAGGSSSGRAGSRVEPSRGIEQMISRFKDDAGLYEYLKSGFDRCASLLAVLERSRGRQAPMGSRPWFQNLLTYDRKAEVEGY